MFFYSFSNSYVIGVRVPRYLYKSLIYPLLIGDKLAIVLNSVYLV